MRLFRIERAGRSLTETWGDLRDIGNAGKLLCPTLERPLGGEHPCIPPGTYDLHLRQIGTSRFDDGTRPDDYLKRFGAFSTGGMHAGMLELVNVPGRVAILIHIGNYASDTEGCVLTGSRLEFRPLPGDPDGPNHHWISGSVLAYRLIYPTIRDAILHGGAQLAVMDPPGQLLVA